MIKKKYRKLQMSALLLLVSAYCFSQSQYLGVYLGSAYNHFMSDQQHVGGNPGMLAGVTYNLPIASSLDLNGGVEYLQQGGSFILFEDNTRYGIGYDEVALPIKTRDSRVTLHTVNVPVSLNFLLINQDNLGLSLGLGPEVSYLLRATANETITAPREGGVYVTYSEQRDETNNYEEFNVAGSAHLKFLMPLSSRNLFIGLRYRQGILATRQGYSYLDLSQIQGDMYQSSYILTLGITF